MNHKPLQIRLLGPIQIKYENEIIKINRRLERVILYVLAIEHKPVSRTKLIDLIWPDASQSDPRATLRTALSRLRNSLPDPDLIITELDQVWLDNKRSSIDLKKFEDQYENLRHLLSAYQNNRTLPVTIVDQISNALDLWHGDKLISGDNIENYVEINNLCHSTNNRLNHKRKYLLRRLAEHYQTAGQFEKALAHFMSLAKVDPSDVSCQCAALDILIDMGRRQDAINYCDTLEDIYEREFNAPLPDEILARCQPSQFREKADHNNEQNQWPIPLSMQLQLIGRQTELYQLQQAFYKGGMILLQGEMGSGKTRLVQELFRTLSPKPLLLVAPSREMENNLPFSPIIHCLRNSLPADIWKEIDPIWLSQLSLLLPELTKYLDSDKQPPYSKLPSGNQQLFDALLNICKQITLSRRRILFFLDDAHWADLETLQAFSYLISSGFFAKNGLLVIASRSEEKNRTLDLLIDQSFRSNCIQIIKLNGLSHYELWNLSKQVLDHSPSQAFIDKLYQETNGNPFLALEIIRSILESDDNLEDIGETSSLPLPMNVYALMRRRLSQLDETSRYVLCCAAVLGSNIHIDLLQAFAEISPRSITKILDPLVQSEFIYADQKNNYDKKVLRFSHEKMREVILKETPDIQLQVLHRQVASLMAKNPDYSDKAAVIAHHFLKGDDPGNAFHWFIKAADHAWILGSKEETNQAYRQAEKLLNSAPSGFFKDDDMLQLYHQWGEFAYQSNQTDLLEQMGVRLQFLGDKRKNPLIIGVSKILLANACFLRLEYDTSLELINAAIENFKISNEEAWLIKSIKRRGVLHWWMMNYAEVEASAKKILKLTQNATLDIEFKITMEFNARYLLNYLQYTHGEAKLASQCAEELYKDYFNKLRPIDKLKSLFILGYSHLISGRYQSSEYFSKQGLEIATLLDNVITGESILSCLSRAEFLQGKLDQSYQHALEALKSAEKGNRKINIVDANCLIGDIYRILQNYTAASQYYRIGQIREGFSSISLEGININTHLAQMLAWTDQISEAKELLQRNLSLIEKHGLEQHHAQTLLAYGICFMKEGNFSLAEEKFIKGIQIAEQKGLSYESVINKIGLAQIMLARHEIDKAQILLKEIRNISQSKNMVWAFLNGLKLSLKLYEIKNMPAMVKENQILYDNLIKIIEENTRSEPLKKDFIHAKQTWDQEHQFH